MRRRDLIIGATAAGLLTTGAGRFDGFRQKNSRFWKPQYKPYPRGRIEFDPDGELSNGLAFLVLPDELFAADDRVNFRMGWHDYVNPNTRFQGTGVPFTLNQTQQFGYAVNTPADALSEVLLTNDRLPSTAVWSFSALVKFDGVPTNTGTYGNASLLLMGDMPETNFIAVNNNNGFLQVSGNTFSGPNVATITTWTRVTVTSNGSTASLYLNGIPTGGTVVSTTAFTFVMLMLGWPYHTADFFYWTRSLSPGEALQHYLDPYNLTMRPRGSELWEKGTAVAGASKKSQLLVLGVGQ